MALFNKSSSKAVPASKQSIDLPEASMKYQKPKILLLDLPGETASTLRSLGFNIGTGTLGKPYKVPKSSNYRALIGEGEALNYTEQEIVIVDLTFNELQSEPSGEKHRPDDEPDIWGKCDRGFLDPRVRMAINLHKSFDRIHSNGGAFVVFADAKTGINLQLARSDRGNLYDQSDFRYDVWDILPELADMEVLGDSGTEIGSTNSPSILGKALAPFLKNAHFTCTLKGAYRSNGGWETLAVNKYGVAVALARCLGNDGTLIVLPQIDEKKAFLSLLLTSILPELAPHLFPEIERGKWAHTPEYELPIVLKLAKEKEAVQIRAAAEIAALDEKIVHERKLNGWMHDLVTGTDAQLVDAVKETLGKLGFGNVVDVDHQRDNEGKQRREDLQIHDDSPTLIVDIKGLAGHPSDDDASQSYKHATLRIQEWKRFGVQALTIINHQRHLPPLSRDNVLPFRQEILDFAGEVKMGLITAYDLWRFVRNAVKWGWKSEYTKPILYGIGRIVPIPKHYVLVGTVAHVWTGAVSIQVTAVGLKLGDRIAFELDIDFEEQDLTSLQIDKKSVEMAPAGARVGTVTKLTRPSLRDELRVFLVQS